MSDHTEEIKKAQAELEPGEILFIVGVEERHVSQCLIAAKSAEEAVMKVRNGEGDHLTPTDYVETLDHANWGVQIVPPQPS